MDKPGPRYQALKDPIIERPDLQSPQQRTLYGILTLVFWALWFYLWLPVLALIAWIAGVQQAYKYMIVLGGYHEVIRLMAWYSLVIVLLGVVLLGWAAYNIIRFRGVEKRNARRDVTAEDLARSLGVEASTVDRWQREQRLYVTHDEEGSVTRVDILVADPPVPM